MYGRKWKPSKTERKEFAEKMREIDLFCKEHNIEKSLSGDSYYFILNGKEYRVSNHSIESSNDGAFDQQTSEQIRPFYHEEGRLPDVVYIHASKTRIIDIYNDLSAGYALDGNGRRK